MRALTLILDNSEHVCCYAFHYSIIKITSSVRSVFGNFNEATTYMSSADNNQMTTKIVLLMSYFEASSQFIKSMLVGFSRMSLCFETISHLKELQPKSFNQRLLL